MTLHCYLPSSPWYLAFLFPSWFLSWTFSSACVLSVLTTGSQAPHYPPLVVHYVLPGSGQYRCPSCWPKCPWLNYCSREGLHKNHIHIGPDCVFGFGYKPFQVEVSLQELDRQVLDLALAGKLDAVVEIKMSLGYIFPHHCFFIVVVAFQWETPAPWVVVGH